MSVEGQDDQTIAESIGFVTSAVRDYLRARYKTEADKLWSDKIRAVGYCQICGNRDNLNAHHLLEKSVWTHLRYDVSNGVCLCCSCHTLNPVLSAHHNPVSTDNFIEYLNQNMSSTYRYFKRHKTDKTFYAIDYREAYLELL
jgi:hypothetical protein